jgi:hypothetical protein
VPTIRPESHDHPLHEFLGFEPDQHLVSLSLRDPSDIREMPANTKDSVSAVCIRGVRKVSFPHI